MLKISRNNVMFSCPDCGSSLPFKEVFKLKKDGQTVCENCKAKLTPASVPSALWSPFLGIFSFIIPAQTVAYLSGNAYYGITAGIIGALVMIFSLTVYFYNTTPFVKVT